MASPYRMASTLWRLAILVVLTSGCLHAQAFDPQPPDATPLFDAAHNAVFFGYGSLLRGGPPLRAYVDGRQRGGNIRIYSDFPNVEYAVVNGFAAGPATSSVLSVVLGYGNKVVRHALLFYDEQGQLVKVWDTDPYYTYAVAVDGNGDVYTLAMRIDIDDKQGPNYPLLIHYSPDGHVVQKLLPKSTFSGNTAEAITSVDGILLPVLRIYGDRVFVFAPVTHEVVIGTMNSDSWKRFRLSYLPMQGVTERRITRVDFTSDGDAIVEVSGKTQAGRVTELQRINPRTSEGKTMKRWAANAPSLFLGVVDDRWVEISRDQSGRRVLRSEELPPR